MSSALAKLSQIPVRAKFLIAIRTITRGQFNPSGACAFALDEGQQWGVGTVGTIMTEDALDAVATTDDVTLGNLYRDLGRQVMVVDAAGAHLALFREAMPQANADAEGIATIGGSVWLCVWRADGSNVAVARTG